MREAQAESSFPLRSSKKTFEKTSQNIWWFENNSLPLHPLLRSEARSRASKKTSKKVPQKFGGYTKNSLPLQPLSDKNGGRQEERSLKRFFEEIYINNTVVQEQNWKQFWVKKEPSIPIYIGNELLIRNPDRATTYLDII